MTSARGWKQHPALGPVRRVVRAWRRRAGADGPTAPPPESPVPPAIEPVESSPWAEVAGAVGDRGLTYLTVEPLVELAEAMADIERRGLDGHVVEAGTALGGSAVVLGRAKSPERPLLLHDVFGQIPPPGEQDGADVHERYQVIADGRSEGIDGQTYYGYRGDLVGEVTATLADFGLDLEAHRIRLVQGLFQDTVAELTEPVALAHLDGDWYESTMVCLVAIAPLVVPGGRIVIDDYDAWSGCRQATDEFLETDLGREFTVERRSRLHLVRPT